MLSENAAGYCPFRQWDPARHRPVWCDVWYPAAPHAVEPSRNYGLGEGSMGEDAALADSQNRLPVVVLSHGAGGSPSNYAWLAEYFARNGIDRKASNRATVHAALAPAILGFVVRHLDLRLS